MAQKEDKRVGMYDKSSLRRMKIDGWFEMTRATCPICHHQGFCCIHESGKVVGCVNVPSKRLLFKNSNTYLHHLDENSKVSIQAPESSKVPNCQLKGDSQLHQIYNIVLSVFKLSEKDRNHMLKERGLSSKEIDLRQYGSFTTAIKQATYDPNKKIVISLWEEIFEHFDLPKDSWKGVPGFYQSKLRFEMKNFYVPFFRTEEGILVPYRNDRNEIVGLQTRVDQPKIFVSADEEGSGYDTRLNLGNYLITSKYREGQPIFNIMDEDGEILLSDEIKRFKEQVSITVGDETLKIKFKKDPKYKWVSSGYGYYGTNISTRVHVSYNIQRFEDLERHRRFSKDTPYINQIKSVFLTEGAMKADIINHHLSLAYSQDKIDEYGADVLAIPGVTQYSALVNQVVKMKVENVIIAFDMDFLINDKVKESYKKLISGLKSKGVSVKIAVWSLDNGKGLDDCFNNRKQPRMLEA